jgi:hypothetical protein
VKVAARPIQDELVICFLHPDFENVNRVKSELAKICSRFSEQALGLVEGASRHSINTQLLVIHRPAA